MGSKEMRDPDPVIFEAPVHFSNLSDQQLILFQYPTLPNEPYFPSNFCMTQRYKQKNRLFEFDIPIETEGNQMYDHEKGTDLASKLAKSTIESGEKALFDKMTYSSLSIPFGTLNYLVGIKRNGKFHFGFLDEIHQMRPSMKYLDQIDTNEKEATNKEEHSTTEKGGVGPSPDSKILQMQFKRRETEEELDARLRSFAHFQKVLQEESWKPLRHHSYASEESLKIFDKLLAVEPESTGKFIENSADYFARNFPTSFSIQTQTNLSSKNELPTNVSFNYLLTSTSIPNQVKVLLTKMSIVTTKRLFELLNITDPSAQSTALQELEKRAFLIDGRWIVKNSNEQAVQNSKGLVHKRNYLLWMFSQNIWIDRKLFVKHARLDNESAQFLLEEVATCQVKEDGGDEGKRGWVLKVARDDSFVKKHPGIVKRQKELFAEAVQPSLDLLLANNEKIAEQIEPECSIPIVQPSDTGSRRGRKPKLNNI